MEITPALLRMLGPEIEAALVEVGSRHGLALKVGSGKYTSLDAEFKLLVKQGTDEGFKALQDKAKTDWDLYSGMLGVNKDWFGREFTMQQTVYRVAGVAPSRSKRSIKITRVHDSKPFVIDPETLRRYI